MLKPPAKSVLYIWKKANDTKTNGNSHCVHPICTFIWMKMKMNEFERKTLSRRLQFSLSLKENTKTNHTTSRQRAQANDHREWWLPMCWLLLANTSNNSCSTIPLRVGEWMRGTTREMLEKCTLEWCWLAVRWWMRSRLEWWWCRLHSGSRWGAGGDAAVGDGDSGSGSGNYR